MTQFCSAFQQLLKLIPKKEFSLKLLEPATLRRRTRQRPQKLGRGRKRNFRLGLEADDAKVSRQACPRCSFAQEAALAAARIADDNGGSDPASHRRPADFSERCQLITATDERTHAPKRTTERQRGTGRSQRWAIGVHRSCGGTSWTEP